MSEKLDVQFVKNYCNIDEEEAIKRVQDTIKTVQEQHHVYRCIEKGWFARSLIHYHPMYRTISTKFKDNSLKLLELGCCFGTDCRKMISDGLHPDCITVSDLTDCYWKIGKQVLFKDDIKVKNVFTDFANVNVSGVDTFDVISAQLILHILSKEQCEFFLRNCFKYLNKQGILFGSCVSTSAEPREWGATPTKGLVGREELQRYLHNQVSLRNLFQSIGYTDIIVDKIELKKEPDSDEAANSDHCIVVFSAKKPSF